MRYRRRTGHSSKNTTKEIPPANSSTNDTDALKPDITSSLEHIRTTLGNSTDIVIREIPLDEEEKHYMAILYTDGLADQKVISESVMMVVADITKSLVKEDNEYSQPFDGQKILEKVSLVNHEIQTITDYKKLFHALLSGDTIFLIDGLDRGIAAGTRGWKDRGVMETNDKIVEEVRTRLNRIDVDSILESGYIEELIQDKTLSPFPTVYNTERPDVIAAELLEGKIAILVDGTPFVLVVPALFVSFLHAAEDYYQRADISSFLRLLRYLSIFISLLGPSLYIAITTFHQEMLPTRLIFGLAGQREQVPFPAFVEAVLMELTFEILREAGVRLPKNIGSAISIVGTLVIGQAAVEAGIISPAMVIVVAITAISSFVVPSFNMSIAFRMLRFPLMALAGSFGLFGILVGVIAIILHLCSLRSFGIPYMSPFAPLIPEGQKDSIFRLPHWLLSSRPRLINQTNYKRRKRTPPQKSRE